MTDNAWTDCGDIEPITIDLVRYDVEARNGHIGKLDESPMEASSDPLVAGTDLWILGKQRLDTAAIATQLYLDNETVPLIMTRTRSSMPRIGMPPGPTTSGATSPRATSDSSGGHLIGQHRAVMASTGVVDEEHDGVVSQTATDRLHPRLGETVGAEHHPISLGQLGRRHLALVTRAHGRRRHALDLSDDRAVANV